MTLPEILSEIESKNEGIRQLEASIETKKSELQSFIVEKLGVDTTQTVTIGSIVRLIEKVLEARGQK